MAAKLSCRSVLCVAYSFASLFCFSGLAQADDGPGDASTFCKAVGTAIAENHIESITELAENASYGNLNKDKLTPVLAMLKHDEDQVERFDGPTLISTKEYGGVLRKAWYFVVSTKDTALYLECISIKVSDRWVINHFYFDPEIEKLHLE